ncbi:MAG: ribosomal protein S18-alanine N-acetyltransferase [Lactobacillaceae bacterium]|jgi:ribosomal-protein-alanine N-acetyltransferase|nr:ribosomal protein S18-alanine N-acetyltransferase [Lactobacillaceae bacterium]
MFSWIKKIFNQKIVYNSKTINIQDYQFLIRQAKRSDASLMVKIEKLVYNGLVPWNEYAFIYEMRNSNGGLYLVAEDENQHVVAFIGSAFINDKELHITNIAVLPKIQRLTLGSFLIDEVINFARDRQAKSVTLELRESNKSAMKLYFRKNFEIVSETQGYYDTNHEDAINMELIL